MGADKENLQTIFDQERGMFVGFEKKPALMKAYWFCAFNALKYGAKPPTMGKMVTLDLGLN